MKKNSSALRVAGLRGLIAVRIGHPMDRVETSSVLAGFDGLHIRVDSFLTLCYPAGGNDCYPYTAGGHEFQNSKSSVGSPAQGGPRMPFTGAGSTVPLECNACRPTSKN